MSTALLELGLSGSSVGHEFGASTYCKCAAECGITRTQFMNRGKLDGIIGNSPALQSVLADVKRVAATDSTVLILGDTGTGKELISQAIHNLSARCGRPFIKLSCAAIPFDLLENELFGHEKGAFTGALARKAGRFEMAHTGTLFLDEIGDIPLALQPKLLRVLQEQEFERLGSGTTHHINVRLVAATHRDLGEMVTRGEFRTDLYYRLNVFPVVLPPLRERADDIPLLVEYFVDRFARNTGTNIGIISNHTLEQLQSYHWPGNIREVQNVVERAVILSETDNFVVDERWLKRKSAKSWPGQGLSALIDREVEMIEAALSESHGRVSGPFGAATKLGIPRQTLESKIRRLGIDKYAQKPVV